MADYTIELIKEPHALPPLIERLDSTSVMAVDIETINWWNRLEERIALIQLAFRTTAMPKVVIIDALAGFDLEPLRVPLENLTLTKAIHNAVFDATRLNAHFKFKVMPIHDTMVAARRSGEKRYSLQAQAKTYLGRYLDKSGQRSDWSRRPLEVKQLHYAADDAFSTLLLYENQLKRNLNGTFQLKPAVSSQQGALPLLDSPALPVSLTKQKKVVGSANKNKSTLLKTDLPATSLTLLGIIAELPNRYHPDQLAVSVGSERVGLAGWIVDRLLGAESDFDETTAKLGISDLCERKLVRITATRRLEATDEGTIFWRELKPSLL